VKDNCIYYLSHWNIKTVQSKSATREYLGTLITILQLTSSSLMNISWVYSLFPVLYINTVKSVLATICIKQQISNCAFQIKRPPVLCDRFSIFPWKVMKNRFNCILYSWQLFLVSQASASNLLSFNNRPWICFNLYTIFSFLSRVWMVHVYWIVISTEIQWQCPPGFSNHSSQSTKVFTVLVSHVWA
jgi:hypothetical protein